MEGMRTKLNIVFILNLLPSQVRGAEQPPVIHMTGGCNVMMRDFDITSEHFTADRS